MYKKERSSRESAFPPRRRTPSFSSTLLDSIYRSIDEPSGEEQLVTGIKKQSVTRRFVKRRKRGALLFDELPGMKAGWRREAPVALRNITPPQARRILALPEAEEACSLPPKTTRVSKEIRVFRQQRAKPLSDKPHQKPKCEGGGFHKTKLRALKIYGELKKVKQPISPGGRIASFLNSIFNSASAAKKVKICSIGAMEDVSFERKSKKPACSSVTPFSRSCLSKTPPPPRGKPSNGTKRSVRFYPVSVIVDEDSRPCGHKCIYEDDPGLMPMPRKAVKSNPVKELEVAKGAAADYLRSYRQKKNASEFGFRGFHSFGEDDSDSDDESCASSDLFELDHLIGIGRFREGAPGV
uniref:Protein BIG GRAIN 1-like A n=1 Tax=Salix viminalis TaxID=40686 RepID=A0A6N2MLY4_SALVM